MIITNRTPDNTPRSREAQIATRIENILWGYNPDHNALDRAIAEAFAEGYDVVLDGCFVEDICDWETGEREESFWGTALVAPSYIIPEE